MSSPASSREPLVSLRGLGVRLGRTQALRGIDLDVPAGGSTAVIGADGAGKSTLIRVLAGLCPASEGRVARMVSKTDLGFSGSVFDLYGDLTVMENLRFFASVRGMRNSEFRRAAATILELVGLTDAGDRPAAFLSGGMKKKLGLAAALIHKPKLLLLDEPTVGVDPTSRRELWGIVAEAYAAGTTVVFATTYLDEAARARRVVLLTDGQATEMSPDRMRSLARGWTAWVLTGEVPRKDLRLALAGAGLDARVYLRQEGLAILARSRREADELAATVLVRLSLGDEGSATAISMEAPTETTTAGTSLPGPAACALEEAALTLDDLFVLVQMGLAGFREDAA